MSYQAGDACFPTALSANIARVAREVGSIKQIGSGQYVVDVVGLSDTSITYAFRDVSSNAVITSTEAVSPIQCQLLGVQDAVDVGWKIALAWLVTYCVVFLIRVIRDEMRGGQDDIGNT